MISPTPLLLRPWYSRDLDIRSSSLIFFFLRPGPCPPCPQMLPAALCYCRAQQSARRCGTRHYSCGALCNKLLACGIHRCPDICHQGDCLPCTKESAQSCVCGRVSARVVLCATPSFHCATPCGRLLACGHHYCDVLCHAGPCGACPRSGARSCPCGKKVSLKPCSEDIATCGDTCNIPLACGEHRCANRCHTGPCGECQYVVDKICKCRSVSKSTLCSREFLCDRRCMLPRTCGRHTCRKKCCDGHCLPCDEICNRKLNCGNHKCLAICHAGPCYPCPVITKLACPCGKTTLSLPCGRDKSNLTKIRCRATCEYASYCRHPAQAIHACHPGTCPMCKLPCRQGLPCGHACQYDCHDLVPLPQAPVTKTAKKKGQPLVHHIPVPTACPPCSAFVQRVCVGAHVPVEKPCWDSLPFVCSRRCERLLPCQRHDCLRSCHEITVDTSGNCLSCGECEAACMLARPPGCTHACRQLCHPHPCDPCSELIRIQCRCKSLSFFVSCLEYSTASPPRSCGKNCVKELQCGHGCAFVCHDGPCSPTEQCRKKITCRCPCKRIKRVY